MFYVLEGTLTMRLGDETTELPAGSFVCVPPGVVHTFSNPGETRCASSTSTRPRVGRTT
jgi:mannose-6-phosphate isomerase-like protein (cupin superfamily)